MKFYSSFIRSDALKARYGIALIVFLAVTAGFASLADEVREGDTLPADRYILTAIHDNLSNALLNEIIPVATNLAGVPFLFAASALLFALLAYKRLYSKALFFGLVMAGAAAANVTLKLIFERQRPELWQRIVDEATFSFPSGHAMGSMAIGLALMVLTWRTKWRVPVLLLMSVYIAFIGFSRLYLGVHYPSDILAGWLLSAGWVGTLFMLMGLHKKQITKSKEVE